MKLGFIDTIFANKSFEEVMDFAADQGFDNVEVACWPKKSQTEVDAFLASNGDIQESLLNYFIGITHIDVHTLTDEKVACLKEYQRKTGVAISALAYYANPIEPSEDLRRKHRDHYMVLIEAAARLDINMVTTFIGRDQTKTVRENIETAVTFWTPIIRQAEAHGVRIAIENCPMYFNEDQWPGGQNLMTSPAIWRQMFAAITSDNFGLCYDPSHMIFQHMDYINPIYDFADKIFYIHFKDAKVLKHKLDEHGIMAYPLQYTAQKLPGLGDIDWGKFVSALNDIGYEGYTSIEIEDTAFDGSDEAIRKSLILSKRYLSQFVIRID
ncbi:sugar phosphate isomerase/epimerase [Agrobacterium rosae]|uniref:sugar phosphate isomerase/epimerase family protein n=1 Tax=Agrobacterium rosae TaxID=1972867 RepID=UPI0019D33C19|nr:sugar phosphate isomerase/epimerase family protein [Agrobacterium rosae]MBN7807845.1 sugar phosphate isomerase/epimerase [Agrobacterium rosae]